MASGDCFPFQSRSCCHVHSACLCCVSQRRFLPNPNAHYFTWLDVDIFGCFISDTMARRAASRHLSHGSSNLPIGRAQHAFLQQHPDQMRIAMHSFTYVHTVRPMSGTVAHPFHFMGNSAGCESSICVFVLVSILCAVLYLFIFLSLLQVCACVCACARLLGVFTYSTLSQCAYVHTAASVTQLGSVWSKGSLRALICFHSIARG